MNKTVGIVGLGIMGGTIAHNLIERGWRVVAFDIDAALRTELEEIGGMAAPDVGRLTHDAPIIMTSLPTPEAVRKVAREIAESGESPRIVGERSVRLSAPK